MFSNVLTAPITTNLCFSKVFMPPITKKPVFFYNISKKKLTEKKSQTKRTKAWFENPRKQTKADKAWFAKLLCRTHCLDNVFRISDNVPDKASDNASDNADEGGLLGNTGWPSGGCSGTSDNARQCIRQSADNAADNAG